MIKKFLIYMFLLLVIPIAIMSFNPTMFSIVGTSMFPIINHGDVCITYNAIFGTDISYKQGDIVIFDRSRRNVIKRVIGVPGDNVTISNGIVKVNNKIYNHPSILLKVTHGEQKFNLNQDEYFVLGDNRSSSKDSRTFGPIRREEIIGKLWIRWASLTQF